MFDTTMAVILYADLSLLLGGVAAMYEIWRLLTMRDRADDRGKFPSPKVGAVRPMRRSEMQRAIIDIGYRELTWAIARRGRRIVWLKANLWGTPNWEPWSVRLRGSVGTTSKEHPSPSGSGLSLPP